MISPSLRYRVDPGPRMQRPPKRKLGKYLAFKARYLREVLSGRKSTTIRLGVVTPTSDVVYLECGGYVYGEAYIESVHYVKFSELTERDARRDGFSTLSELREVLTDIYPGIGGEDWVTIIKLRLLRKYFKPVPRWELESRGVEGLEEAEIARLGLAYGASSNSEERRILAAVACGGGVEEAREMLGRKYSESYIRYILHKVYKKLVQTGAIKRS